MASSIANSSYGERIQLATSASEIAVPDAAIFTRVSVSGTCLTQTTIFMVALRYASKRRKSVAPFVPPNPKELLSAYRTARPGEHGWHVVEVAVRVGVLEVDRGRRPGRAGASATTAAFEAAGSTSRCPVIDFVELNASRAACSPNTVLAATESRRRRRAEWTFHER